MARPRLLRHYLLPENSAVMPSRLVHRAARHRIRPDIVSGSMGAYAVLEQQVIGLEKDVGDLSSSIVAMDRKISDGLNNIGTRLETAVSAIHTKLDERSKTHWPTLIAAGSLLVLIMGSLGTLAYMPIREKQDSLSTDVEVLRRVEQNRSEELGWLRAKMGERMPSRDN